MIDERNFQLYQREIERLTSLPGQLDAVHANYLADIQDEFKKRPALEALWARNPKTLTAEEMQSLRDLEYQLGVYKQSRDLERVRSISDKLDDNQKKFLEALEEDVDLQKKLFCKLLKRQKKPGTQSHRNGESKVPSIRIRRHNPVEALASNVLSMV